MKSHVNVEQFLVIVFSNEVPLQSVLVPRAETSSESRNIIYIKSDSSSNVHENIFLS